jgi:hypothetical protein
MNRQQASLIIELVRELDHPLQKIMDFAQTLEKDEGKELIRATGMVIAEISLELEAPIYKQFPDLDRDS